MLGAIIGDIVGSRFEFNPTNDYHFELFTSECGFTDDTICTIAVADAILQSTSCELSSELPYGEYIHRWCRRYPYPMGGYGGRFAQWVRSDNPKPYNSFGNGSAMRVSPVAWVADSYARAILHAGQSAMCTHSHPEGIKGAEAVATVIFDCLQKRHAAQPLTQDEIELCLYMGRLQYPSSESLCLENYRNHFDETCQGTVPVAFKIIEQSHSFEDAIRRAVSLGADADTLGAIVGSIAEAIWGIPEEIESQALTYLPQEMLDVLTAFRAFVAERQERERLVAEEADRKAAQAQAEHDQVMMHWQLAWGNPNIAMGLAPASPAPTQPATADDWQITPMPEDGISTISLCLTLSTEQMERIRMGHIPDCQEDHWFMYVDKTHIHFHRSWTGVCVLEAHYRAEEDHFVIDRLVANHALSDFGIHSDESAVALLKYLLTVI